MQQVPRFASLCELIENTLSVYNPTGEEGEMIDCISSWASVRGFVGASNPSWGVHFVVPCTNTTERSAPVLLSAHLDSDGPGKVCSKLNRVTKEALSTLRWDCVSNAFTWDVSKGYARNLFLNSRLYRIAVFACASYPGPLEYKSLNNV